MIDVRDMAIAFLTFGLVAAMVLIWNMMTLLGATHKMLFELLERRFEQITAELERSQVENSEVKH